jgi:hypothetical protein
LNDLDRKGVLFVDQAVLSRDELKLVTPKARADDGLNPGHARRKGVNRRMSADAQGKIERG